MSTPTPVTGFVVRRGTTLYEPSGAVLRFASFNTPGLTVTEDGPGGWARTTASERLDLLETVRRLNGRVVRTYTLSIPAAANDTTRHVVVSSPAAYGSSAVAFTLNEPLFVDFDNAISTASARGVRLIVPLIDAWEWWGGAASFAAMYNSKLGRADAAAASAAFFSDPTIVAGFKALVTAVLSRNNTVTGRRYADEPAILAWETGNELGAANSAPPPAAWTLQIANHIKSLAPKQLVMDGSFGIYGWPAEVLDQASPIDILSNHYYGLPSSLVLKSITPAQYAVVAMGIVGIVVGLVLVALALTTCGRRILRLPPDGKLSSSALLPSPSPTTGLDLRTLEASPPRSQAAAIELRAPDTSPPRASGESAAEDASQAVVAKRYTTVSAWLSAPRALAFTVGTLALLAASAAAVGIVVARIGGSPMDYAGRFAADVATATASGKAFIAGEFGLARTSVLQAFMDAFVASTASGALCWSLRPHASNDTHVESGGYYSYHYPGFPAAEGFGADEQQVVSMVAQVANTVASAVGFATVGKLAPETPVALTAAISTTTATLSVSWRGSVGAASYTLYSFSVAASGNGTARAIASGVLDNKPAGATLFSAQASAVGVAVGHGVYVVAVNDAGTSDPSNVITVK
nr:hypothetical protein HK105_006160 [Polyrhizophydium stewartii]